ncbi:DUF4189 domain-containing protein [Frateuria defendens]|uniref:DUF4189 domain-containing protein n=1 Tax=Frateuria defendens TaxID=2219559 RepID=UPI0012934156|nr:DUF4189 domain-containing protein [Frateuria defendens]
MEAARVLLAFLAVPVIALASPSSEVPPEVKVAAPSGTSLLAYTASGSQPDADAAAVFDTVPDKAGVRHRTLVVFGEKNGKFRPDFSSEKLIACSKCSQFHDDPFDGDYLKVTPGHIHIDQMDGGEKPSTSTLDFVRKAGTWHVTTATRLTVSEGRYDQKIERLPLPASGLAADLDARWTVPEYVNTLLSNQRTGKFIFAHGDRSPEAMWANQKADCNEKDCAVLVQQGDGCMALVRDESGHFFGGGSLDPEAQSQAQSRAMEACHRSNGKGCKPVRTDCSVGIRTRMAD